jgi:hypothetical protein
MSQLYYFSGGKSDYWIPFTLKLGREVVRMNANNDVIELLKRARRL